MLATRQETWHTFTDSIDHRPAPPFRLHAGRGRPVASKSLRGRKNVVMLFLPTVEEEAVRLVVERFAAEQARYRRENCEVLIVLPLPEAGVEALQARLDSPFPLLADPGGKTRRRYEELLPGEPPEGHASLFVLDRFLGCYAALRPAEPDREGLQEEILEWLDFIELQCPE